jgi:hypothetical protein
MEDSDPAKKVLCTKPGGSGDRKKAVENCGGEASYRKT